MQGLGDVIARHRRPECAARNRPAVGLAHGSLCSGVAAYSLRPLLGQGRLSYLVNGVVTTVKMSRRGTITRRDLLVAGGMTAVGGGAASVALGDKPTEQRVVGTLKVVNANAAILTQADGKAFNITVPGSCLLAAAEETSLLDLENYTEVIVDGRPAGRAILAKRITAVWSVREAEVLGSTDGVIETADGDVAVTEATDSREFVTEDGEKALPLDTGNLPSDGRVVATGPVLADSDTVVAAVVGVLP